MSGFQYKSFAVFALLFSMQGFSDTSDGIAAYKNKEFKAALHEFLTAARQGDAVAQSYLGEMYRFGEGVPVDNQIAASWYTKAANQRHVHSQAILGAMYAMGQGVEKDINQVVRWMTAAADQGDLSSKLVLAEIYSGGALVPQDHSKAFTLYRSAAELGNAKAQHQLGVMYQVGQGVPENRLKAVEWYRAAAEQGYMDAQYNLGAAYDLVTAFRKISSKPLNGTRRRSARGCERTIQSRCNVSIGEGVEKNSQESIMWYSKAAEGGHPVAQFSWGSSTNRAWASR